MKISFVKAALAATALTLSASTLAYDHGPGFDRGGHHHGKHVFKMFRQLDLTESQKAEIKAIFQEYRDQRGNGDRAAKREKMQAFSALTPADPNYVEKVREHAKARAAKMEARMVEHAERQVRIYAILTPEQQQKLADLRAERIEKFKERRRKHHD